MTGVKINKGKPTKVGVQRLKGGIPGHPMSTVGRIVNYRPKERNFKAKEQSVISPNRKR